MSFFKRFQSVALTVVLSISMLVVSQSPAGAEGNDQLASMIDWSGISLSPTSEVSQEITVHSLPNLSEGQVDWSINLANSDSGLWAHFNLSNTGRVIFAFFDAPPGSKVENVENATCNFQALNAFQTQNTWRSTCSAPLIPSVGESYNFSIKPLKINGSQWWAGFVTIKSTGKTIALGRLENNATQQVLNNSLNMQGFNQISFYKQPLPECSKVPEFSATFGPIKNQSQTQPTVRKTRLSTNCPAISRIDSKGANTNRVDMGLLKSTVATQELPKKVESPSFSLVNFVGNKVNININLGSSFRKPDAIYLVAPKIGVLPAGKIAGRIQGSVASWSIDFSSLLSGGLVPIRIVGVTEGIERDIIEESFDFPDLSRLSLKQEVPVAPKNVSSRVIGTSGIVTATATLKPDALVRTAYLFSNSLGIKSSRAIKGEVIAARVIFEIPIEPSMAGKSFPFTVYFENATGKSLPAQGKISIPGLPKISTDGLTLPTKPAQSKTILCSQGSQARAFVAKACPPGWKKS